VLLPKRLAQAIIVLVSLVWACNFGLQFLPGLEWKPDVTINGIFMGVVGGALALSRKGHKDDDDPDDSPERPPPEPPDDHPWGGQGPWRTPTGPTGRHHRPTDRGGGNR
jgi:hypothetical protein